jgi:hypothetical protein
VRFEWDDDKAARNVRLPGVSFEEACELFTTDAPVLEVYDAAHSVTEDRFKSIDQSSVAWSWSSGLSERMTSSESSVRGGPPRRKSSCTLNTWRT